MNCGRAPTTLAIFTDRESGRSAYNDICAVSPEPRPDARKRLAVPHFESLPASTTLIPSAVTVAFCNVAPKSKELRLAPPMSWLPPSPIVTAPATKWSTKPPRYEALGLSPMVRQPMRFLETSRPWAAMGFRSAPSEALMMRFHFAKLTPYLRARCGVTCARPKNRLRTFRSLCRSLISLIHASAFAIRSGFDRSKTLGSSGPQRLTYAVIVSASAAEIGDFRAMYFSSISNHERQRPASRYEICPPAPTL